MNVIVCTGPECSGKSSLSKHLATSLSGVAVAEAARIYLSEIGEMRERESFRYPAPLEGNPGPAYVPSDLLALVRLQSQLENTALEVASSASSKLVIADTDLQVLYIWWQEKFGPVPNSMRQAYASQCSRYYLLCKPDLEWEADPQRENPHDRMRLFELYEADLVARNLPYAIVEGEGRQRCRAAEDQVARWLAE